jgi:hypothetical protein
MRRILTKTETKIEKTPPARVLFRVAKIALAFLQAIDLLMAKNWRRLNAENPSTLSRPREDQQPPSRFCTERA